ncbi:hypothetical protein [Nonomuraea sp. NPDC050783]|uniref:hypothetical protein n=1 Tax=Nonomuraea sp. NPDC050783 TaxID=3154634 RepID=UPI003466BFF2
MATSEVRLLLEEIMASTSWPVYSPFAREHYGRGREEGKAEGIAEGRTEGRTEGIAEGEVREAARMVLLALGARGLKVTDDLQARITGCADVRQLETWLTRAMTARTAHDLFAEGVDGG